MKLFSEYTVYEQIKGQLIVLLIIAVASAGVFYILYLLGFGFSYRQYFIGICGIFLWTVHVQIMSDQQEIKTREIAHMQDIIDENEYEILQLKSELSLK